MSKTESVEQLFAFIQQQIDENNIVLFIKGEADEPLCGFSSVVVRIFTQLNIPFQAINVLSDQNLRQAIKDFTNWPTIPQVYIQGDFIGGSDILREMFRTGELSQMLTQKGILPVKA